MNFYKEKVAILLCVKDSDDFIEDQLSSLRNQKDINYDLFIGDDGCSNKTLKILKRYSKKIFTGPRNGFAANFISSLRKIPDHYDYYCFCDHDDIWMDNKLKVSTEALRQYDNEMPNLYCGRTQLINEIGNEIGFSPLFKKNPSFYNALVQSIAGGNTMTFNIETKKLLAKADLNKSIVSHDWLAYILVTAFNGNVFYDPIPLVKYRIHKTNKIGSNTGIFAILSRYKKVLNGTWKKWIDSNISQISEIIPQGNQNFDSFKSFLELREGRNVFKRLHFLYKYQFYRQTALGNFALIIMVILKKL